MAKLKDFLLDINKTLSIPGIEALSSASDITAIEIDDDTLKQTTEKLVGLMSKDAAQNNHELEDHFKKKLYPTIKGELLGNIDTDLLKNAKSLFGDDAENEFKEIEFTSDKIKKFTDLTKVLIEKGSGDAKLKEVNTGLKKQIKELSESFDKDISKKDKEIKNINSGFNDLLIRKEFNNEMSNYNLGEKFNDGFIKDALFDKLFKDSQQVAKLTLSEKGSIIPMNPENSELELFVNNEKVGTMKQVLDPLVQPYIVKKSGKPGEKSTYKPVDKTQISTMASDFQRRKENVNEI